MSILNYLRRKKSTASVAKERLQIIISHERSQRNTPDYLPQLQEEILAVITKYIPKLNRNQVSVNLERMGDSAVLELNITMPDAHEILEETA
jgi:cell division topological specificity factor